MLIRIGLIEPDTEAAGDLCQSQRLFGRGRVALVGRLVAGLAEQVEGISVQAG